MTRVALVWHSWSCSASGIGPAPGPQDVRAALPARPCESGRKAAHAPGAEQRFPPMSGKRPASSRPMPFARPAEALGDLEKSTGTPVLIESIETLKGEPIDEVAAPARPAVGHPGGVRPPGSQKESKIEVLPPAATPRRCRLGADPGAFGLHRQTFARSNFDEGLREGDRRPRIRARRRQAGQEAAPAEQPAARDDRPGLPVQAGLPRTEGSADGRSIRRQGHTRRVPKRRDGARARW